MIEKSEIAALMRGVSRVVKDFVIAATTPIQVRLDGVERTVRELPTPRDGRDGQTPEVDYDRIATQIADAIKGLPPPKDGQSVTVDDVRPMISEAVAKAVADIPITIDMAVAKHITGMLEDVKADDPDIADLVKAAVELQTGVAMQGFTDRLVKGLACG